MMPKKIIVIGAGIVGASTAYYLAKKGADVTIVDRSDEGQATAAAAGMICPWLSQRRNKAWYFLVRNGAKLYPSLVEELREDGEKDTGYSRVGALCIHNEQEKLERMRDRAIMRREEAPEIGEVTLLDEAQTKERLPLLASGYRAVHVAGGARVDGRKLRDALISAALKHGATVKKGSAELVADGDKITGITLEGSFLEADQVVAATGAWMNELFSPLGVQFQAYPQRAQIIHLQLKDANTANWPVLIPPKRHYMLGFDGGRIVAGATHEDDTGFDCRITAGGQHEILSHILELAPGLSDATISETRVGFRPFTPNFLPVIGRLPGYEGIVLANGLGSSGLTMGPFIGKQLAGLVLDEEIEINLDKYDVKGAIK